MSSILNEFPIFDSLCEDLKIIIKSFYISQNKQSNFALFVTNNDLVYCSGNNTYGKLGLGHNNSVKEWTLITQLCDQNISEFFEGFDCIFAKSTGHQIYGWGCNTWGQLGRGCCSQWNDYLTPALIDYLSEKCIVDICCGSTHYLALSSHGQVYSWGRNTWGQVGCAKRDKIVSVPVMLDSKYGIKYKIKSIYCSDFGSFAIAFDGQVYSWGLNFYGDLGHNNWPVLGNRYVTHPKLIAVTNIAKMSSFNNNNFFLDNQGYIFGCGKTYGYKLGKCKFENFCDISGKVIQSNDSVFEISDENSLISTNCFNIWDYFINKFKTTPKTFHLSEEGLVLVQNIVLRDEFIKYQDDLDDNFLYSQFENIFEGKFEKGFNEIRKIGSGGYGTVYEVMSKYDRVFAIKALKVEEVNLQKLSQITLLMPTINSDFVVKIISSWIERKGIGFIQMEMCLGNLASILSSKSEAFGRELNDRLDSFEYFISCEILREVTQSVNYLHSLIPPIIHSNLKSENILITDGKNGRFFKLSDFGLTKTNSNSSPLHKQFIEYMAPEVINDKIYRQESDVYSLAIIANQLFGFNTVTHLNDIDERLEKYFNTTLVIKCKLLLETLSTMISLQPEDRPNCLDLLSSMNNWTIDRLKLNAMQNYGITMAKLRSCKNNLFIDFIEKKVLFN